MLTRYVSILLLCLTGPAMGQGLSASDCVQIQTSYGVTPTRCQSILGTGPGGTVSQLETSLTRQNGSVPQLAEPTREMRQNSIFFTRSGTELSPGALLQIQRLAELLNSPAMQRVCLKLTGHSDSSGSNLVNMEIGAKRAAAVRNRLALLLNNANRIEVVQSLGEDSPLLGLNPGSVWQRRVTIWARDCPGF